MRDSISHSGFGDHVTLGTFEVGGRVIAIDVTYVREVVRWQSVTPLPNAPSLIEGVVDLRGVVVPVVDLCRALNGSPLELSIRTRIVVTEIDGLVVGFGVDAAIEVLQIDATSMEDPPQLATQAGYGTAKAVVRRSDSEPIVVLSLEHLLERIYSSALPVQENAA
jgi:purine-binding chemotaxis protein CheW